MRYYYRRRVSLKTRLIVIGSVLYCWILFMNFLLSPEKVPTLIGFGVLTIAGYYGYKYLTRNRSNFNESTQLKDDSEQFEELPYYKKESLFTNAERKFYFTLKEAANKLNYAVFSKVRLEDLVGVRPYTFNLLKWRGYIRSRHIDFILCDKEYFCPILAIELDGSSHSRFDRIERDNKVDSILDSAGLSILRIENQQSYDQEMLSNQIISRIRQNPS